MWERCTVRLDCGCTQTGRWDRDEPGDEATCATHGTTMIVRIGRVRYGTGRAA